MVDRPDRWNPFHELPLHLLVLLPEIQDLILILLLSLLVPSLHFSHLSLQRHQECHLLSIRHFLVHHASG